MICSRSPANGAGTWECLPARAGHHRLLYSERVLVGTKGARPLPARAPDVWPSPATCRRAAASRATASRPSTISTSPTPLASASVHARSFAIIPAVAVPPPIRRATPSTSDHGDGGAGLVEHAGRRAGDDEAPRLQARRQVAGERVGIDVEQPAVRAEADACDDRDEPGAGQRRERRRRPPTRRNCRRVRDRRCGHRPCDAVARLRCDRSRRRRR